MKNTIVSSLVLAALFILSACSEKFKVAAPYKSVIVVSGLLDKNDTAHYVRIQKAFLDDTKSALTMALVSDSSYFSNITVKMERIGINSGTLFSTIPMNRVDLNNEGYQKQAGTFFTSPNYAYKFKAALDPDFIYRLVVTNNITGEVDSSDAPIIEDQDNTVFHIPVIDVDTTAYNQGLDFASTNEYQYYEITGQYIAPTSFSFEGNSTPVGIVQAFIRFQWYDSSGITGLRDSVEKYYDYNIGTINPITGSFDYQVKNLALYNAVSAGLGNPPTPTTFRLLDRCELLVYAGTYDFNTYLQVASVQGLGLTGNDIEPTYSNVKGAAALGLFTSRGLRTGYLTLSPETVDSLMISPLTANTNIKGTSYR